MSIFITGSSGFVGSSFLNHFKNEVTSASSRGQEPKIDGANVISVNDDSNTNEIQDLTISGDKLKITNNGTATEIDLASYKELPTR